LSDDCSARTSYFSKALLTKAGTMSYEEPYIFPDEELKASKIIRKKQRAYTKGDYLKLYPNPAVDYLIIQYSLNINEIGSLIIRINDLSGKTIKEHSLTKNIGLVVLSTKELNTGTYLCTLNSRYKTIGSARFFITK
jgi:hypothetical protein